MRLSTVKTAITNWTTVAKGDHCGLPLSHHKWDTSGRRINSCCGPDSKTARATTMVRCGIAMASQWRNEDSCSSVFLSLKWELSLRTQSHKDVFISPFTLYNRDKSHTQQEKKRDLEIHDTFGVRWWVSFWHIEWVLKRFCHSVWDYPPRFGQSRRINWRDISVRERQRKRSEPRTTYYTLQNHTRIKTVRHTYGAIWFILGGSFGNEPPKSHPRLEYTVPLWLTDDLAIWDTEHDYPLTWGYVSRNHLECVSCWSCVLQERAFSTGCISSFSIFGEGTWKHKNTINTFFVTKSGKQKFHALLHAPAKHACHCFRRARAKTDLCKRSITNPAHRILPQREPPEWFI